MSTYIEVLRREIERQHRARAAAPKVGGSDA